MSNVGIGTCGHELVRGEDGQLVCEVMTEGPETGKSQHRGESGDRSARDESKVKRIIVSEAPRHLEDDKNPKEDDKGIGEVEGAQPQPEIPFLLLHPPVRWSRCLAGPVVAAVW